MRPSRPRSSAALFLIASALIAAPASAVTYILTPSKDNTLVETPDTYSNGAGDGIYAGRTMFSGLRRGLVAFNLGGVPVGSTVTDASLTMHMSKTLVTDKTVTLHRMLADWGEGSVVAGGAGGAAQPGDATWLERFFGSVAWTDPGGDYTNSSGGALVGGVGDYTWTSEDIIADVQFWVNNPNSNFGWLVRGAEGGSASSKKFDSGESANPPRLTVTFTPSNLGVPARAGESMVELAPPYPAPATGIVNLSYRLPHQARVSLAIHDATGRVVRRLVEGEESAGRRTVVWDGRTDAGSAAAAGVYWARLGADGVYREQRVPLLR